MFNKVRKGYRLARRTTKDETTKLKELHSLILAGETVTSETLNEVVDSYGKTATGFREVVGGLIYDVTHPRVHLEWADAYVRVAAEKMRREYPTEK